MKRSFWFPAVLLTVVSTVDAADRPRVRGGAGEKTLEQVIGRKAAFAWRSLIYRLPGAYALLDRVKLTDDQNKVLGEISLEWRKKWDAARDEAVKQVRRPDRKDMTDDAKRAAYYAACRKAGEKARPPLPMDAARSVLTMEQVDRLDSVDQAVKDWQTWLRTTVDESEKKLDKLLGATPGKSDWARLRVLRAVRPYVEGGQFLTRLGVTAEQKAALDDALKARALPLPPARARQAFSKVTYGRHRDLYSALSSGSTQQRADAIRAKVNDVLTAAQRKTLAAAAAIASARAKAIAVRFEAFRARLDKVLPPPKRPETEPPQPPDPLKDYPEAKETIASFGKWLDGALPRYRRQLVEALGAEPDPTPRAEISRDRRLEKYLEGASLLWRLRLTDEQREKLDSLKITRSFGFTPDERTLFTRLAQAAKIDHVPRADVEAVIRIRRAAKDAERLRAQLEAILTDEQRAKLAKAAAIVAARNKAVRERYTATVAALRKTVPDETPKPPRRKP